MIPYAKALEKLVLYLNAATSNNDERVRLIKLAGDLEPTAVEFLAAVLRLNEETSAAAVSSKHITASLEQLMALVQNDNGTLRMYTRESIKQELRVVTDLGKDDVRRRCLYTLYRIFSGSFPDEALALLDTLEELSGGYLFFAELSEDDAVLYRKMYCLLVCAYSKIMSHQRIELMLQTQLFMLVLLMDVEIIPTLGEHIWGYLMVHSRRSTSMDFAAALALNHTPLGHDVKGKDVEMSAWVNRALGVLAEKHETEDVNAWLTKDPDILSNNEYVQFLISRLVVTYVALVSGYFIIDYHGEAKFAKIMKEVEEEYKKESVEKMDVMIKPFPELLAAHTGDFGSWVMETPTLQQLLKWLASIGDKKEARQALAKLLRSTMPDLLTDMKRVSGVLQLDTFLKNNGYTGETDMVYFNEKDSTFHWNESV